MFSAKGKVTIVTGASSGIGMAVARLFATRGAKLILAARREDRLVTLRDEIVRNGGTAIAVRTDVSSEDDCRNLIETALHAFGRIDILINNAGVSMRARFLDVNLSVLRRLMEVNFWGTVYCTKYALPHLLQTNGYLLAVSSIAGFKGLPGRTGYSASKFAMNGFIETVRIEHLRSGLHVMLVAPAFTRSEIRLHALEMDGRPQGNSPLDESHLMKPEWVAKRMYWGLMMGRRNVIIGLEGQLLILLQRILPKIIDRLEYWEMAREKGSPLK